MLCNKDFCKNADVCFKQSKWLIINETFQSGDPIWCMKQVKEKPFVRSVIYSQNKTYDDLEIMSLSSENMKLLWLKIISFSAKLWLNGTICPICTS